MIRLTIFLALTCISGTLFSQLATWPLAADANPASVSANVNALPFTNGSGTGTLTIGSTGAYCSGWTTNTGPDATDYFQIAIAPQPGYRITLQTIAFSERRSLTGPLAYQLQCDVDSTFSNSTTLTTFTIPDNDLSRDETISGLNLIVNDGDTLYIRWYGYGSESSAGTWRINAGSLQVGGLVAQANPNDVNSYAFQPVTQVPSAVLNPASGSYYEAFRFNIVDAGTSDGLPTDVTLINIANANPPASAVWTSTIAEVQLKQGANTLPLSGFTVTNGNIFITLAPGTLQVSDDNTSELSLYIRIQTAGITDGSAIQFMIPASNPGWDASITGSGFDAVFPADVVSSVHTVDIQATNLSFTLTPPSVWQNVAFGISAIATDDNGNTDANYTGAATLSLDFGNGSLSSPGGLSRSFSNGIWSASDLVFDGTEWMRLRLTDNAGTISPITTNLIYAAADGLVLDDNFNDGSFPEDPVWIGTTADFIVTTDTLLHLFTTSVGDDTSYVVSPVSYLADSVEWSARIKLNFDPSSSNWTRYYLVSDQPDLKQPVNGYFIRIGETGSTDAIELFRNDYGTPVSILRGPDGQVATSPDVRIKVVGYNDGTWKVYSDLTGNYGYQLIGTVTDTTYRLSRFFSGFFCKYTQTYASGKFYFDDAYCGPVRVDTVPPSLTSLSVIDSATVELVFSEAIAESDAQNAMNFVVSQSVGNPTSATQNASDKTRITLSFSPALQNGTSYLLSVSGLHDLAGNEMPATQRNFSFYNAGKFDVVINEILADPSPAFNLPEWEFVELHNRSLYDIELNQWTLSVGSTIKTFPTHTIPAGSYLILTHEDGAAEFDAFGNTLGLFTSSTMMTNSGALITLKDKYGNIIHSITYSDTWYKTNYKKDGGWSLEQIDPANPCGEGANWKESVSSQGGTPGTQNSAYALNPDNQGPQLIKTIAVEPDTLFLYFSEILDTAQVSALTSYTVDHGIGSPISAGFSGNTGKVIVLRFNTTFQQDTIYTLTMAGIIRDCVGNPILTGQQSRFVVTGIPAVNEVVINEVLFDPKTDGVDFVELYNRSGKSFNLKDLRLVTMEGNQIDQIYILSEEGQYLFAGDYLVLTTSPAIIASQYYVPYPGKMAKVASMPTYSNESGRVTLANRNLEILDDFSYSDAMHFQLLSTFDGVSLERVNYDLPVSDAKNWHSAAQNVGYATPTYRNSQFRMPGTADGDFSLEPEIFSPDMDGYHDVLNIYYQLDEPGYVATVVIYDAAGRRVRQLVAGELLSTSGFFVWDGLNDNNNKALAGIYVVYAELFDLNGNLKHYKKTCVVATRND